MTGRFALGAAACALAACSAHSAPPPSVTPPPPSPSAPSSAEARARAFLQRQIDAALSSDRAALHATFAKDAIVFTPLAQPPAEASFLGIGDDGPGVSTTEAAIAKIVAEGTADAVWFYADVTTVSEGSVDGEMMKGRGTTRVVELLTASEGWHAVAGSFTESHEVQGAADNREVPNATAADGPLAQFAEEPRELARHLAPKAIAVGPTAKQLAVGGPAAREALLAWNLEPLSLYQRAREVRTKTWGFVQANLDRPKPNNRVERLSVQLFAVPAGDRSWRVVLAQYMAQ